MDNLLSVEIVLASGEVVNANEREHADLFWAIRGIFLRVHGLFPQVGDAILAS